MDRLRSSASPVVLVAVALLVSAVVMAVAAGCGGDAEPEPEPTATPEPEPTATPEPEPEPAATTTLTLYFTRGEKLGVGAHEVPETQAVARAAMEQLLAGPDSREMEAGLGTEIPEDTTLKDVSISDGVATVDLSSEFESGGGSLSMQLRVAQVVYTLTRFPTVESVAFEIDGTPVEAIGGEGVMVSPPVGREDFAGSTLPAILVESPAPWQEVSSPLRVTGVSNTFEGTYLYEIVDQAGLIVEEGFGTSTGGMGTWGTFDVTIPFDITREGIGALIVFEQSAKDGSRINLVEIPLDFVE